MDALNHQVTFQLHMINSEIIESPFAFRFKNRNLNKLSFDFWRDKPYLPKINTSLLKKVAYVKFLKSNDYLSDSMWLKIAYRVF